MKNFIVHTDDIRGQMLKEISCASLEDLFKQIPVKLKEFNLSNPLSELETQRKIKAIANKNKTEFSCFLGGGVYNKFIPAAVKFLMVDFKYSKSEFLKPKSLFPMVIKICACGKSSFIFIYAFTDKSLS